MKSWMTFLLIFLVSGGSASSWAKESKIHETQFVEVDAKDIADREYYRELIQMISGATVSIDVAVEAIEMTPASNDPVRNLIDELIRSTKRGVKVRVFLNTFSSNDYDAALFLRDDALGAMRENGVKVHYVDPKYYLSDRLAIIDGEKVLEGGPAWTKPGFQSALSSASLVHSKTLAQSKRRRLETLPLWNIKALKEHKLDGRLPIPIYLLKEVRYFPGMMRNEDDNALRIYLALLRMFYQTQNADIVVRYEEFSSMLPGDRVHEDAAVSFQVRSAIERLEQQYMLIKIVNKEAERVKVQLDLPKELHPVVGVPHALFDENYAKELSAQAMYVYIVMLYRAQISGDSPVWLGSESNIQQDFPITTNDFRKGVAQLRKMNLIEVFPFYLNEDKKMMKLERPEYRYVINSIPTLSERLEMWDRLRDHYGDMSFSKARDLADIFGEPGDPKVILTYMELLQKFSIEDIRSYTHHVAELPSKSTPEMLEYLSVLLQNETQRNFKLATS